MKKRKTDKPFIAAALVAVLLAGALGFQIFYQEAKNDETNRAMLEQSARILTLERHAPYMARLLKCVDELTAAAIGKMTPRQIIDVAEVIEEYCVANRDIGLTEDIVFAVMEIESGFNPKALSIARAYGLFQCLEPTFRLHLPAIGYAAFTEPLAYNPMVNAKVGIMEIARLRRAFLAEGIDSWYMPLTAYCYGEKMAWMLITSGQKPSLDYGKNVMTVASKWRERGL